MKRDSMGRFTHEKETKAAPKFKVGDHILCSQCPGRKNNPCRGIITEIHTTFTSTCYEFKLKNGRYLNSMCGNNESKLSPDTRSRVDVTAIDKNGKLHKWHFYGEPDWKRLEREVFNVGVAAIVEGENVAPYSSVRNIMGFSKPEMAFGPIAGRHELLCRTFQFGCALKTKEQAIAALRARICEVYGKPETQFKVGDWVMTPDGKLIQIPKSYFSTPTWERSEQTVNDYPFKDCRPARLSDYRVNRHGVNVLMTEAGGFNGNLFYLIIGEHTESLTKTGAELLATALGCQIAPAGLEG